MTANDSHAHALKRGLKLAPSARYAPDYDATPEDDINVLDANDLSNAVPIQPSFLGTDNSDMLDARKNHPSRFQCVAVVDPEISLTRSFGSMH